MSNGNSRKEKNTVTIREIELDVEHFLQNKELEKLTEDDYNVLLDEVFYSRLKEIPSEKIEGTEQTTLKSNELLSTSPNYQNKSKFNLVDDDSQIVVQVLDNGMSNNSGLNFVLPFRTEHDKRNFIYLLAYLDEISKIKYPETEIEVE